VCESVCQIDRLARCIRYYLALRSNDHSPAIPQFIFTAWEKKSVYNAHGMQTAIDREINEILRCARLRCTLRARYLRARRNRGFLFYYPSAVPRQSEQYDVLLSLVCCDYSDICYFIVRNRSSVRSVEICVRFLHHCTRGVPRGILLILANFRKYSKRRKNFGHTWDPTFGTWCRR